MAKQPLLGQLVNNKNQMIYIYITLKCDATISKTHECEEVECRMHPDEPWSYIGR